MKKPAYALATILILLGVVLFAVGALVSTSTLESKISRSNSEGVRAYYAAESGVEDAFWRLKNTPSYSTALLNGTLNVSYSATDKPDTGEGFAVTIVTSAQGAGYATIDVVGTSNNTDFTAKRHITDSVFQGPATSVIGTNAFFTGGNASVGTPNGSLTLHGGDLYAKSSVSISNATVNLGTNQFQTTGTYSGSGTITSGGIHASNFTPAATPVTVPGFDFAGYGKSPNYTVKYTPAQFASLISSSGSPVNIPGPITYVDGAVQLNSSKALNITGMLIINGTFDAVGQAKNATITVNDPGNGKSGIFVLGDIHAITGTWNINGVVYSGGGIHLNNSPQITISGAMVSAGDIAMTPKSAIDITYNSARIAASLGSGTPQAIKTLHQEEDY
jgi:Tfp pilus assembly protein PilX